MTRPPPRERGDDDRPVGIPFPLPATSRPTINIGEDRRITILWMIWRGWALVVAAGDVDSTWDEVPTTTRLRKAMREVVPDKDIWVREGEESRSREDVLRPDGQTDIPIAFTSIREELDEHDPHAIIECKRLAESDSTLCREYEIQGIRRFVSGSKADPDWPKYVANHALGFMVAYLLSGSPGGAAAAINRRLHEAEHLHSWPLLQQDWMRVSVHRRKVPLAPITLSHVFLPFAA